MGPEEAREDRGTKPLFVGRQPLLVTAVTNGAGGGEGGLGNAAIVGHSCDKNVFPPPSERAREWRGGGRARWRDVVVGSRREGGGWRRRFEP